MSLGNMNYQQQFQQQPYQEHPELAAVSGNNYAYASAISVCLMDLLYGKLGCFLYSFGQERAQTYHPAANPYHTLAGAGTNLNSAYTSSGHSGYGSEPTGGSDYHHSHPPTSTGHSGPHVSSGGGYAYHATGGGSNYGPPPIHPTLPTIKQNDKKKQTNASTMNALTLLSFFFFVNLLQSCLKEQMEAMNPTVMVMTAGVSRNRFNKLAEMNSREQSSSPAATFSSGGKIVVQPEDLISAAGGSSALVSNAGLVSPTVKLQSPYESHESSSQSQSQSNSHTTSSISSSSGGSNSNGGNSNTDAHRKPTVNNFNNNEPPSFFDVPQRPRPEFYDPMQSYPNRTLGISAYNNDNNNRNNYYQQYQQQHQHQQQHYQRYKQQQTSAADNYAPWSYGAASSSSIDYPATSNRHGNRFSSSGYPSGNSPWSSGASPDHVSGSNYFDDEYDRRYGDAHYTRFARN
ncbi:homeobox protein 2 [Teleopsis dalmanni]|uniref:homeobox protein 2 n=1 Tax=Teleopsis dalmanni TaxID=139649 RepID=UPI0018CCB236|nr:homeobox protein 2 [Teleopsis dalmanni]